jgi:hypothetical protein
MLLRRFYYSFASTEIWACSFGVQSQKSTCRFVYLTSAFGHGRQELAASSASPARPSETRSPRSRVSSFASSEVIEKHTHRKCIPCLYHTCRLRYFLVKVKVKVKGYYCTGPYGTVLVPGTTTTTQTDHEQLPLAVSF